MLLASKVVKNDSKIIALLRQSKSVTKFNFKVNLKSKVTYCFVIPSVDLHVWIASSFVRERQIAKVTVVWFDALKTHGNWLILFTKTMSDSKDKAKVCRIECLPNEFECGVSSSTFEQIPLDSEYTGTFFSISPTFYMQLLCAQIPKVQRDWQVFSVFGTFGIYVRKNCS